MIDGNGTTIDGDGLASAVPPIRGKNQLMLPVWGGVDKRGDGFGGRKDRKGQGGSDLVEITSSPLDQFQINFSHTPER
jgi:hypothetical protein